MMAFGGMRYSDEDREIKIKAGPRQPKPKATPAIKDVPA
jgi:hypothetical protein